MAQASDNGATLRTIVTVGGLLLAANAIEKAFGDGKSGDNLDDLPDGWKDTTPPTLPNEMLGILADQMDQALIGGFTEDEDTVYRVLGQLRNTGDLYGLAKAFGSRCAPLTFGTSCGTLAQWMVYQLSATELDRCNAILRRSGILLKIE